MTAEQTKYNKPFHEVIADFVDSSLFNARTTIPAKIVKYDSSTQQADVELLVKQKFIDADGNEIEKDSTVLPDIPVAFPAASSTSFLYMPVAIDTVGEVTFFDRSTENWIESDGVTPVTRGADLRSHDLSFGYFTPGLRTRKSPLEGVDADNVVIRSEDLKMTMKTNGKLKVENSSEELLAVLSDLISELVGALVITGIGSQPFTPATIAALEAVKTRLDTFKE